MIVIQRRSKAIQGDPTIEEKVLELIGNTPSVSRTKLSELLNISERQVRKIIERLRNRGILTREGGNSGRWIIN